MTVQYYPNGIGGTAPGDSLDIARPLQTSGNIWYVSSLIGIDAASPAGQNREKPLATVAQALTNALPYDIIVFLPGHTQTLTAAQVVNTQGVILIGEGTTSGKPAVSFLINAAGATDLFTVSSTYTQFRNIYFPPAVQANTGAKVQLGAADGVVKGCYFECGEFDTGTAVGIAATRPRIENSTFISTATLRTAQPRVAIEGTGAATVGPVIHDTVVSAGTVGFSNYSAVDLSTMIGLDGVDVEGLSLLLGADMALPSSAKGHVNIQLATGGSRAQW